LIPNRTFSYSITALVLLVLVVAVLAAPAQAQTPIGYWQFDAGSGAVASDSSGNGHTASLANGVRWVDGKIGGAVSANAGLGQSVSVPDLDFAGTTSVSVALWSKRTYSLTGNHVLFAASSNASTAKTGFVFLPDDSTCQGIQLGLHGNFGYTANCYVQPSSGVWHHFTAVFDTAKTGGNSVMLYVDGVLQSPARSLSAVTNTNTFGHHSLYLFSQDGTQHFDSGIVDDLRVYRSALTGSQVQRLYQFGLSQISKDVFVYVDGSGTLTTPRFTTSSNAEPLLAFVAYDGPTNAAETASVSGGGLNWTLVERSNHQLGTAEIWSAVAPNAPFSATVTSRPYYSGYHGSLTVIGFANASGAGVVAKSSGPSGAPDVNVPGVVAGNWVFAVGNDWDNAIPRTPVNGQVLVHQDVDNQVNDTYWVQSTSAPSSSNGAVDIHDTAPTSDQWNYAAVAIAAARQGSSYSISGSISGPGGPGAKVTLSGAANAVVTADSSGNYLFSGLLNGNYTVTPSKIGYVYTPTSQAVTVNGGNVTGVNFSSADPPSYSISGTISGAGGPGATVTLSGAANAVVTADSGGNYSFASLQNGNYTVTPSKSGYVYTPASHAVTINGANVTGVNFSSSPVPTYSISGTIGGPGGPGATVTLSGAAHLVVTADSGGNYSFTGLQNGNYTVTPTKSGYIYAPASQAVTVNGANITGVNFSSSAPPTYSISGTISGAGGPGATVTLSGAANAVVTADSGGNYSFGGLQNGNYTVTPSKSGYVYTPASQAVTINGANLAGVNFSSAAQSHWVDLSWTASVSQVIGYNVYRAGNSGGPYTKINSTLDPNTTYTDQNVQSGSTYYYVTTAVDAQNNESVYSNQAVATIP
jgi:uncharacterized protein YjbI with pentapeptide repeats